MRLLVTSGIPTAALELARDPGERRARDHRRDRRDARLVPADARVDDRRARVLDGLRQFDDLLPVAAALDQVEHREPVDEDEVRADRRARPRHDLERQPHAVRPVAAPAVDAPVGARGEELVDEVALAAHHLDAVIAGLAGEHGRAYEGRDLAADAGVGQFARRERGDGRLQARWRDGKRMIGVATGVQDLHADAPAFRMHRAGHEPVPGEMPAAAQGPGKRLGPARRVRRDAAGHDQPDAAARAFREVCGELRVVLGAVLEPGVHRAHQHAVRQRREPEVERRQQVWERVRRHARNDIACQSPCRPCSKYANSSSSIPACARSMAFRSPSRKDNASDCSARMAPARPRPWR